MDYSDIKDLTVEELTKRQKNTREELFELKMKHSLGQLANPLEIRGKRRDVARIKTALHAKLSQ
ncbi:MAG: 50S ribosomal protein L29 [Pseudobdellovibrionaceae bacterium]|nr:50S ribosomal protein L29 [Bdellovibrionales bacterium]USN46267.1 MAG: 50S ribosomal protein L29 [Pseudobdellovibrionaceae bacterium]